jgi:hypothetical protein
MPFFSAGKKGVFRDFLPPFYPPNNSPQGFDKRQQGFCKQL